MKKLFPLFFLLTIVAIDVQAQTFIQKCSYGQELKYLIQADQKTVALVEIVMEEYLGEDYPGDLVIPEKVTYKGRDYAVTAIGKRTFVGNYGVLQTVHIPKSITSIDGSAFGDGGETGIYDVTVAKDNPVYQVEGEELGNSAITKLVDKRTGQVLWFTVEEFSYEEDDPEVEEEINIDDEGPIIRIPASRAEYPGGMAALQEYLAANCHYPKEAQEKGQQGVVILEFVVENDGTISTINVLRGVCEALDKESIRVVRAMPKWIPAQDEGQPCRSYFQLPITYMMQ